MDFSGFTGFQLEQLEQALEEWVDALHDCGHEIYDSLEEEEAAYEETLNMLGWVKHERDIQRERSRRGASEANDCFI
jgi:hypothetical protein